MIEYFTSGYSYMMRNDINNNETMPFKVMLYSSPAYARSGYIDPNCTWVEP